ncbi:hypothetical protein AKJ16_DCAP02901 [Drosera capensis]
MAGIGFPGNRVDDSSGNVDRRKNGFGAPIVPALVFHYPCIPLRGIVWHELIHSRHAFIAWLVFKGPKWCFTEGAVKDKGILVFGVETMTCEDQSSQN